MIVDGLRIAVVSNLHPSVGTGGAERYVGILAEHLARANHVLVLTGNPPSQIGSAEVRQIPSLPGIGEGFLHKSLWHARDQWSLRTYTATKRALAHFAPDVVALHSPQGLSASVFSAALDLGVPVCHTLHDYNALCLRASFFKAGRPCGGRCIECMPQRAVRGRLVKRVASIVGRSEFVLERHVQALGLDRSRVFVNRHGLPEPLPDVSTLAPRKPRVVGYLGTLSAPKGIPTLLSAWETAPREWRLLVAGSGRLAPRVVEAAATTPSISFLGRIGGADKDEFFRAIDVLVVPSEWDEPLPQVALEALAFAVPIVASNVGGLAELPFVSHTPPGDPQALVASLSDVLAPAEHSAIRASLVRERPRWSLARNLERQEEILRLTVAKPGRHQ